MQRGLCTSLEQRNPHFSGDAAPPPPISEDDSSQNACLKEEEKAGKSAAAEASAALNVPIYLPAANMLLRKTERQFLERERPRGREALGADRGFFQHQYQCHAFKGCCNWRISPVGQSWREKTDCVLFCLVMRWTERAMSKKLDCCRMAENDWLFSFSDLCNCSSRIAV